MSDYELWSKAWEDCGTLLSPEWVDLSIITFHMLSVYFDLGPTARTYFVEYRVAASFRSTEESMLERIRGFMVPNFRKNFFLPEFGPCPKRPVVFLVRTEASLGHFFTVVIDHKDEAADIYVLGKCHVHGADGSDLDWGEWDGYEYYKHICVLFGWNRRRRNAITVHAIRWENNGYDCGPLAIAAAVHILENGIELDEDGSMRPPPLPCSHFIRVHMYRRLFRECRRGFQAYQDFVRRREEPHEWSASLLVRAAEQSRVVLPDNSYPSLLPAVLPDDDSFLEDLQLAAAACHVCRDRPGGGLL